MEQSIFIFAGINIILALSLYVTMATGQLSLGHGAFMALGAYVSSILTVHFSIPLVLSFLAGAAAAALVGFAIGFPALRIKGIYLAVGTLGFNEMIEVVLRNVDYIGGASGLSGMSGTTLANVAVGTVVVLAAVLYMNRTRLGWAFKAVEQDEVAAQSMGLNVTFFKICAFTISAGIAGIAGAYYAHYMFFIDPQSFGFHTSLLILFYVLIGGYQTPWGAVTGAFLLTLIPEIFRGLEEWRLVVYGIIIVVMMAVRPQGLISEKTVKRIRSRFARKQRQSPSSISSLR
ncbi:MULTISPECIES: branched-chain amino acid ABC transporter permease [unclassified Paenibacillus]|uniref:branched-chain amino acid ABC transporter permease n=1 Tax=unclassified Paenibacillus TaxID=185978 RepID=UPI0011429E9E|nr:branched-chain amino acid ABC transporter permease [Paenibacillus sp. tmac-D7]